MLTRAVWALGSSAGTLRLFSSSPSFPSLTVTWWGTSPLTKKECKSRMPEEFIQLEIPLVLSIPREIWQQGGAQKPDELFWQVGFVMPAQLIFRGFPISLNAEHNCGRIWCVCLFKMGRLKPCKPLLMLWDWWEGICQCYTNNLKNLESWSKSSLCSKAWMIV